MMTIAALVIACNVHIGPKVCRAHRNNKYVVVRIDRVPVRYKKFLPKGKRIVIISRKRANTIFNYYR